MREIRYDSPPSRSRYGPLRASRRDVFPHFPHFAADRRENSRFSPDFPPWWVTYPQVLHALIRSRRVDQPVSTSQKEITQRFS